MKGKWLFFAALSLLGCQTAEEVSAVKMKSTQVLGQGLDGRPSIEEFYKEIALEPKPGVPFTVGDNLAGYYENYTRTYTSEKGYLMKNDILFMNFATFADGKLQDRTGSQAREILLPYGHTTEFSGGTKETLALLSKKYALAVEAASNTPRKLGTALFFKALPEDLKIEKRGNLWLIAPALDPKGVPESPIYAAVNADRPFSLAVSPEEPFEAADAIQEIKDTGTAVYLSALEPSTTFLCTLAFGFSADEALKKAAELPSSNPIKTEAVNYYEILTRSCLWTDNKEYNQALTWAKISAYSMVVEEFGKGIWAGLPWFKDNWGRDTFISLPGTLLATGLYQDAKAVLENFAKYQNKNKSSKDYGRIPNRVRGPKDIIYNTTDGTPWMIREVYELLRYTGDKDFAQSLFPVIQTALDGAIANYTDGDGMLTHDDADTWMDARIAGDQPWSARGNRAVEIQALWYTSLRIGAALATQRGEKASADKWTTLADKLKAAFEKKFWDGKVMADRLRPDGSRDVKVRPNQLMAITVPFEDRLLGDPVEALVLKNAVSELLFPYGIASLSQNDPYFHPIHQNNEYHHKDAAYHNGTIWGWNAGFTISSLTKYGVQDLAWELTENLSQQILTWGHAGTMSELLNALADEDGKVRPSGTYAQAWSVAEFVRNAYQDYLGFRPNLLEKTLHFVPAVPTQWKAFKAAVPYGTWDQSGTSAPMAAPGLEISFERKEGTQIWTFTPPKGSESLDLVFDALNKDGSRTRYKLFLESRPLILTVQDQGLLANGKAMAGEKVQDSYDSVLRGLKFAKPKVYKSADFPVTRGVDVLKKIILNGEFK